MGTLKDIFTFGKKKPESFAERMLHMSVTTNFKHEEIEEMMNVSGMNIDEAESIVQMMQERDLQSLKTIIDDMKLGKYSYKELIQRTHE